MLVLCLCARLAEESLARDLLQDGSSGDYLAFRFQSKPQSVYVVHHHYPRLAPVAMQCASDNIKLVRLHLQHLVDKVIGLVCETELIGLT